ncbi:hypothetical protein GWI34_35825 [Actinomadura sp. DSM 109109]|nr:hypothetical protein [Actinomadura lepetitiana]
MRAFPLAVPLAGLLAVAGCADDPAEKVAPPTVRAGGALPTVQPAGAFAKEGWFGGADGLHARVAVRGVERQGAKAVLRYRVTSMDSSVKSVPFEIALLDTAGRRLYKPTDTTSGSGFAPGATREMVADYPPIPATVSKVTAITPGTAGEITGIPVTGASAAPGTPSSSAPSTTGPVSPAPAAPSVGAEPFLAGAPSPITTSPSAAVPGANPVDLYDIVEGEDRTVSSGPAGVTVGLRGDALFEGGSSKVSARGRTALGEVVRQVKAKAAGTLTVDARGGGSKVSGERAQAVMKEMKDELGAGFTYVANGWPDGDSVDVTYQLKSAQSGSRPPASFHAQDGQKVASRMASFGAAKRRLEVKPFYRDGAYIVAVFDIVNEGPGATPPDASYPNPSYPGGVFGAFSIQVPGQKDVYRAVRVGPATPGRPTRYVDPGRAVFRTAVNEPVRGFVYLPAPPGAVKSVTLDAGPFGKVEKVPVS